MKDNKKVSKQEIGENLFQDLARLIEQSRRQVAVAANSAVTLLFWQVGKRINEEVLSNKRADYGKQIVTLFSAQLKAQYGRNFEEKNLRRMMQFAEQFPDEQIVVTVSRQLSWSHILDLLQLRRLEAVPFFMHQITNQKLYA